MKKLIYSFNEDGSIITVVPSDEAPSLELMQRHCGGFVEHVNVIFHGVQAHMFVHEMGRYQFEERNEAATMIYFAASRLRGHDPEDPETRARSITEMARRLNVPPENIHDLSAGDGKPEGIYGPAVLLVGFTDEEL